LSAGPIEPGEKNEPSSRASVSADAASDPEPVPAVEVPAEPGWAARASTEMVANPAAAATATAIFTDVARRRAETIRGVGALLLIEAITPQPPEKTLKTAIWSDQSDPDDSVQRT
jgi:hypothetical protein